MLVVKSGCISFTFHQASSVNISCLVVDANLHNLFSGVLRRKGCKQLCVMVVDPVLEIVCLGPKSYELQVISIVNTQDLLEHLVDRVNLILNYVLKQI